MNLPFDHQTFNAAPVTRPYPDVARPVVALSGEYPANHVIPPARHPRGQLIYASRGVMTVNAAQGTWVLPPQRAVWLPAWAPHWTRTVSALSMRYLYIDPAAVPGLPEQVCVVNVSPLLRALIAAVVGLPAEYEEHGAGGRLVAVLLDQVCALPVAPLHLPLPSDPRLAAIADALRADPADARSLTQWGRVVGASPRTLARHFARETGLGFRAWRQQMRLLAALERLAAGDSVTAVALDVGYETPSAFAAMFRRALGASPGRYFADTGPWPTVTAPRPPGAVRGRLRLPFGGPFQPVDASRTKW